MQTTKYIITVNLHNNVPKSLYTVSQKMSHLRLYTHGSIATIFDINVAEKVGNQNILYFPTSPS